MLSFSAPAGPAADPSESDFDRLFRLSQDLIAVSRLDGYFKRVNPSWTRVLGWSEEELLSRPVHEFMHPDDRERTLEARAGLARGLPLRNFENRYLCKDGSCRWLAWQSIAEPGASLVFAIARDVTEQKLADHERLILGRLESTGILAGGMAHDFNNLFTSLILNLELAGLSGELNREQDQYLQQARQTVLTARELTRQLLAFAGPDTASRVPLALAPLLKGSFDLALRDSGPDAACESAPDLRTVRGNENQLTQVLRGLLLNAREATPAGGRILLQAVNTPVTPPGLPRGDYVRVTIADTGVGIPAEILPRIFDPYFSTKERGPQKGMGLGLTLCRVLVQRHGGNLGVESAPGRGTTATLHLPAMSAPPA